MPSPCQCHLHRQVAIELLGLAAQMGLRSWRSAELNGKTFRLLGASKLQVRRRQGARGEGHRMGRCRPIGTRPGQGRRTWCA